MRTFVLALIALSLAVPACALAGEADAAAEPAAQPEKPADDSVLKDSKAKFSYSVGMSFGRNFKDQGIEIDPELLAQGFAAAYSGSKTLLTEAQAQSAIAAFQKEMTEKKTARDKQAGAANLKEGEEFLAANARKEGVKTLPSGLQYKVVKEGTGPKPTANDSVTTHYRGTLIDGTQFDSSYDRGEPAKFQVNGVIPGWTEALQLMPAGSKWQLFIPGKLAYGERGAGGKIGPNKLLIFDIELISIDKEQEKGE